GPMMKMLAIVLGLGVLAHRSIVAQDIASTMSTGWTRASESSVAPLRQRLTLDLREATLSDVLDAVARETGIDVGYGSDVAKSPTHLSLRVSGITVGAVLEQALLGTNLTAYVSLDGRHVLVRTPFPGHQIRSALATT